MCAEKVPRAREGSHSYTHIPYRRSSIRESREARAVQGVCVDHPSSSSTLPPPLPPRATRRLHFLHAPLPATPPNICRLFKYLRRPPSLFCVMLSYTYYIPLDASAPMLCEFVCNCLCYFNTYEIVFMKIFEPQEEIRFLRERTLCVWLMVNKSGVNHLARSVKDLFLHCLIPKRHLSLSLSLCDVGFPI